MTGDTIIMEATLEDDSVASAVYQLGGDGVVRSRFTLTSPEFTEMTAGFRWVRRMVRKTVADEWKAFLYGSGRLDLSDKFREGLRPRRPGRGGLPIADLALLVQRYVQLCATESEPMAQLQFLYYEDESKARLNQRLRRAQQVGLFTGRPGRGHAGGEMTEKCKRVLAGELR
jgi:hypothetical protein